MPSLLQLCVSGVVVFHLVPGRAVVISSTAFIRTLCFFAITAAFEAFVESSNQTVAGWYSGLIFFQLSVLTLCVLIHGDHLIHTVKQ